MTCTYRRPAVDGFPRTAPCGLPAFTDAGYCWLHFAHVYLLGASETRTDARCLLAYPLVERARRKLATTGWSLPELAEWLGVKERTLHRLLYNSAPLSPGVADRWAGRFRCHPSELWPEWSNA